MQINFTTITAQYDSNSDMLTATVARVDDEEISTIETFAVELSFDFRSYSISANDHSGDIDTRYMPRILCAFVDAFDDRYMTLDPSSSPADVFDEPLTFVVEA